MPDSGSGFAPIVDIGAIEFQGTSVFADLSGDGIVNAADITINLKSWMAP